MSELCSTCGKQIMVTRSCACGDTCEPSPSTDLLAEAIVALKTIAKINPDVPDCRDNGGNLYQSEWLCKLIAQVSTPAQASEGEKQAVGGKGI